VTPVRLEAVRAALGGAELVAPGLVGRVLLFRKPDWKTRAVARVLGMRHLVQAGLTYSAGPGLHVLGADVDLLHSGSMLLLAAAAGRHRRAALTSAAIAATFAVCEYRLKARR
jgi:hypothetical protein